MVFSWSMINAKPINKLPNSTSIKVYEYLFFPPVTWPKIYKMRAWSISLILHYSSLYNDSKMFPRITKFKILHQTSWDLTGNSKIIGTNYNKGCTPSVHCTETAIKTWVTLNQVNSWRYTECSHIPQLRNYVPDLYHIMSP